jgi:hypothetical protein
VQIAREDLHGRFAVVQRDIADVTDYREVVTSHLSVAPINLQFLRMAGKIFIAVG